MAVPAPVSKPYRRYRSGAPPRAFVAGLLSLLVPGSGQLYAGRWVRGLLMLAISAAVGASVLVLWLQGSLFALRLLVRPDVLLALLAALGLAFAFHGHCVVDAYRLARRERLAAGRPRGRASGRAAALLVLVGALAVPYAAAGYYDFRSYDLLTSVFASEEPVDPAPVPAPVPGSVPAPGSGSVPAPVPAPVPGSVPGSVPAPVPAPGSGSGPASSGPAAPATTAGLPAAEKPSYWKDRGRLNVLLVGGDAGPGRWGLRTDTMIVVSINPGTGKAAVFGVPRNLQNVPFPDSARTGLETFPDILNALWGYAEARPDLFPGAKRPGPTALKETVGNLLGLRIDYYAAVDLRGFVEMVDALGGVTVNVASRVYDAGVSPPYEGEPWIAVDLQPGRHHMDGRLALGYVRTRWATSDYDRMRRQRCVVGALVQEASLPKLLRGFPRIASAIEKFVETDIPLRTLPDLVDVLGELDAKDLVGISFAPPRFSTVHPDLVAIRATVREALRASPPVGEATGLETLKASCG